jgi:hypothetical protein
LCECVICDCLPGGVSGTPTLQRTRQKPAAGLNFFTSLAVQFFHKRRRADNPCEYHIITHVQRLGHGCRQRCMARIRIEMSVVIRQVQRKLSRLFSTNCFFAQPRTALHHPLELPLACCWLLMRCALGGPSKAVDIFIASSGRWSTAVLSEARAMIAATSLPSQGLAIFAGGLNSGL